MVFARYTFKRFSLYFIGIALFFAGLFNLIEFFEKLIRVSSATIVKVAHFVMLHFGPSFVEFLPIASWLAVVLMIKEYHQQHEWEAFPLVMIGKKNLYTIFFVSGIIAGLFSFVLNEWIMLPIASQAERFRTETFKKTSSITINNKTMWLPNNIFAAIGFIDLHNHEGTDLTLASLSPSFTLERVYRIDRFTLDIKEKKIIFDKGYLFTPSNNATTEIRHQSYALPSFFTNLQIHQEIPTLRSLINSAIFYRHLLSQKAYLDIIQQIMKRLLFYLQIILSPLLTIAIFFLTEPLGIWKWLMLIIPYGLFAGLNGLVVPLTQSLHSVWILALFFALMVISIITIKNRL